MQLEEYIKVLEAAGYNVSVKDNAVLEAIMITISRGIYQISGYISNYILLTIPENERNIVILDFIKARVKELDTRINEIL